MQVIDRPWSFSQEDASAVRVFEHSTMVSPGQASGMQYRRHAYAWSKQMSALGQQKKTFSPSRLVATETLMARAIDAWPRLFQMGSLILAFSAAIFASGHVLSAPGGLALCCFGLAVMFFGNFAAYRRGEHAWLVGPSMAVLGAWGFFLIALGIGINALIGT